MEFILTGQVCPPPAGPNLRSRACFNPQYSSHLKSYAELAFKRIIKDELRLRRETYICSDCALLHKLSRKRLVKSLQNMGLNTQIIESYVLAWECFKELYTGDNTNIRQLTKPDAGSWEAIKNLYNTERLNQLSSTTPEVDGQTIKKWLLSAAKAVRNFIRHLRKRKNPSPNLSPTGREAFKPHFPCRKGGRGARGMQRSKCFPEMSIYPKVISADSPLKEEEDSSLLDILPGDIETSLLAEIIEQEETENLANQQIQLNQVLQQAITALDTQSQQLLQLYYSEKVTQKEIAAQLNIKQYTVSRRLSSIKKSLLLTLTINATDNVKFDGESKNVFVSRVSSSVAPGAEGKAGGISITTDSIQVTNGAQVSASNSSSGKAGDILLNSDSLTVASGGEILARTFSSGEAGNITLNVSENITPYPPPSLPGKGEH